MAEAYPQIMALLDRKLNVVTIAQELFFPLGEHRQRALELDARAREAGVRICAVGINPGFAMDLIPIIGSLPCWQIDHVFVRRVVDFSPYGPDEMRHIGVGLSAAGFHAGARSGTIGHIGLLETAGMVGYCLGIPLDELRQTKEPLVSDRARKTPFAEIGPGQVYGFRQNVTGLVEGKAVLEFQMHAFVAPDAREQEELGDYTRIDGTPSVDIRIKEQIAQRGGLGTSATAVNAIPRLLQAPPGLHPFYDLPLPHFWSGRAAVPPVERIQYA
jgi:4-hydroxy-tetrahydrodipicolinate reductase